MHSSMAYRFYIKDKITHLLQVVFKELNSAGWLQLRTVLDLLMEPER